MPTARGTTASALPTPTVDEPTAGGSKSETAVWPAVASGACKACSSTSRACHQPHPDTPGETRRQLNYETVSCETTGHAESVRITYDPTQITYGQLLRVFFGVVQDPTELNYQGPDVGSRTVR